MGGEVDARVGQRREGVVCICAECKKVIKVVGEVRQDSLVSHGICPECAKRKIKQ